MTLASTEESLASQTYRTLRRQIILGQHPQGSRLVEASLAAELHVSRLPVREAVPQLANEGFVRMLPVAPPASRSGASRTWSSSSTSG